MADSKDQLLTITAAARIVDRSPVTLRLWERQGRITPMRDSSGRRLYRAEDVRRVAATIGRPGRGLGSARPSGEETGPAREP
jgi:predicted site-specific integrase-resolvase